jgi:hypothetical protein
VHGEGARDGNGRNEGTDSHAGDGEGEGEGSRWAHSGTVSDERCLDHNEAQGKWSS